MGPGMGFGPGLGPGFGGPGGFAGSSNNNNNNNNNNSANNANMMSSMLSNLLGLNASMFGTLGGFGGQWGGFGGPGMGVCPPMMGMPPGPGFFPQPPGPCCCCCDDENGGGRNDPCRTGVCWKRFRIVSPEGRECSFPVAVPWWCCGDDDDEAAGRSATDAAETVSAAKRTPEPAPERDGCMSASQLLLQRYMIANPPRAFGRPYDCDYDEDCERRERRVRYGHDLPGHEADIEIIPCPDCDGEGGFHFNEAMRDFQKNAVLIPSEEA